jgi:hypothetical protein
VAIIGIHQSYGQATERVRNGQYITCITSTWNAPGQIIPSPVFNALLIGLVHGLCNSSFINAKHLEMGTFKTLAQMDGWMERLSRTAKHCVDNGGVVWIKNMFSV